MLFVGLVFQSYEIVHNVLIFLFLYIIGVMSLIVSIEIVKIGEETGDSLQYACLENPMGRGAWLATVHGVTRVGHNLVTK